MLRKEELEKQGWTRCTTYDAPRLSEMVELYRETGFDVHLETFNPNREPGCSECMKTRPDRYKTIYTRKKNQS